jgi:hypothetical protein
MQVVYTNAHNELEMVYVEFFGAIIIADLLEIASKIHLTILDMQFHNGCAVSPAGLKFRCFKFDCKNVH